MLGKRAFADSVLFSRGRKGEGQAGGLIVIYR